MNKALILMALACVPPKQQPKYVGMPASKQQCCTYLDGLSMAVILTDGVESMGLLVQLDEQACFDHGTVVMPSPIDNVFRPVYDTPYNVQ